MKAQEPFDLSGEITFLKGDCAMRCGDFFHILSKPPRNRDITMKVHLNSGYALITSSTKAYELTSDLYVPHPVAITEIATSFTPLLKPQRTTKVQNLKNEPSLVTSSSFLNFFAPEVWADSYIPVLRKGALAFKPWDDGKAYQHVVRVYDFGKNKTLFHQIFADQNDIVDHERFLVTPEVEMPDPRPHRIALMTKRALDYLYQPVLR